MNTKDDGKKFSIFGVLVVVVVVIGKEGLQVYCKSPFVFKIHTHSLETR